MRRRRLVNAIVEVAATVAALLAVAVLLILVGSVVKKGGGAINVDFFTKTPALYTGFGPRPESGIENAIVGTLIIIGLALLMALPVAILTAIYLNELAPRKLRKRAVAGIRRLERHSGDRARHLRLRLRRHRARSSRLESKFRARDPDGADHRPLDPGGPRTGPCLDARGKPCARRREVADDPERRAAAGGRRDRDRCDARHGTRGRRDPPLLFTSALYGDAVGFDPREPMASIPMFIFTSAEQADPELHQQAWGAAAVLIGIILVASLIARWFADRSVRRLKGER